MSMRSFIGRVFGKPQEIQKTLLSLTELRLEFPNNEINSSLAANEIFEDVKRGIIGAKKLLFGRLQRKNVILLNSY